MQAIDASIVEGLKQGDNQAFTLIFNACWKLLYAAAYRRLGDEALSQDMVQEVFMQLWDKRKKINVSAANIEFYLLRAIKNRVINHYTSEQVKKEMLHVVMQRMDHIVNDTYDPKHYQELEDFVDEQVSGFPETMKAVFLMNTKNYSISGIAESLDLAEQTVKNNLTEANRRLKASLIKKFTDENLALFFIAAALFMKN